MGGAGDAVGDGHHPTNAQPANVGRADGLAGGGGRTGHPVEAGGAGHGLAGTGDGVADRHHHTPDGLIFAFGDSIAAGYGLGPAEHYPDNVSAYPVKLGKLLNMSVKGFASSGACVLPSSIETQCNTPTAVSVQDQIAQAVGTGVQPKVITLTVGANDVDLPFSCRRILWLRPEYPDTARVLRIRSVNGLLN